jgi:hypothetical protein
MSRVLIISVGIGVLGVFIGVYPYKDGVNSMLDDKPTQSQQESQQKPQTPPPAPNPTVSINTESYQGPLSTRDKSISNMPKRK